MIESWDSHTLPPGARPLDALPRPRRRLLHRLTRRSAEGGQEAMGERAPARVYRLRADDDEA